MLVDQTDTPATGTSLRWLRVAPHRLFFFLGMLGLAAASLWWLAQLIARAAGVPLALTLPPAWIHGWLMLNGFLPFFMFGFLFTAGPKWLNVIAPPMKKLTLPGIAAGGAVLVVLIGAHVSTTLVAFGALLAAAAWGTLLWRFLRLVRVSRSSDQIHARLVLASFFVGALAHLAFAAAAFLASANWAHTAQMLSIWIFIAPVYVTVAHRLIPFFTANVVPLLDAWRPLWLLWAMLAVVLGHGLLPIAALLTGSVVFSMARIALDAAGGALVLFVAWRWGVVQSLRNRLLAMLHLGFLWLGIALLLYAYAGAAALAGGALPGIGLAPLHALTMGFFGGTMFAMVTRVTAGHGGRALVADDFIWWLFWTLMGSVVVRILVDALPGHSAAFTVFAVALWSLVCVPWAVRNLLIYLRPRVDGRAG